MARVAVGLSDEELEELKVIIMDKDKDEALKFLKEKIYSGTSQRKRETGCSGKNSSLINR